MSYTIILHFPHDDYPVQLPAVPRKEEGLQLEDPTLGLTDWDVVDVAHVAFLDGTEGNINLRLAPATDQTKALVRARIGEDRYLDYLDSIQ